MSLSFCSAVRRAACAGTLVPSGSVTVRSETAARTSPESVPGFVRAVLRLPRLTRPNPVPFGTPMPPCSSMPRCTHAIEGDLEDDRFDVDLPPPDVELLDDAGSRIAKSSGTAVMISALVAGSAVMRIALLKSIADCWPVWPPGCWPGGVFWRRWRSADDRRSCCRRELRERELPVCPGCCG